jgi:hypothetical protein
VSFVRQQVFYPGPRPKVKNQPPYERSMRRPSCAPGDADVNRED